jgi:hypothetical protein
MGRSLVRSVWSGQDRAGDFCGGDVECIQLTVLLVIEDRGQSMGRMRGFGLLILLWSLIAALGHAQGTVEIDNDHDGLSDVREQALLERFVPRFQVSRTDCAVKPALFEKGVVKPTVVERDGTIYGQVTPRKSAVGTDAVVEIHFYDLWSVDCGRMGHPLDAEHVSVLVRAKTMDSAVEDWTAVYWFAAAHEATVCDASEVGAAKALDAERQGATVWLSAGKHGAFLSEAICTQGCGGDRCTEMTPLVVTRVVNVGEPGVVMNGAVWVGSAAWPLAAKMQSDFSAATIAKLEQGGGVPVEMNGAHGSVKGTIYVANSVANGVGTSGANTGNALNAADVKTEGALAKSAKATGGALKKSTKAVGRFLHLTGDSAADEKKEDVAPQ